MCATEGTNEKPFQALACSRPAFTLHTAYTSANIATAGNVKNKATTFCHFPLTTRAQMVHGLGHNNKTANPGFNIYPHKQRQQRALLIFQRLASPRPRPQPRKPATVTVLPVHCYVRCQMQPNCTAPCSRRHGVAVVKYAKCVGKRQNLN